MEIIQLVQRISDVKKQPSVQMHRVHHHPNWNQRFCRGTGAVNRAMAYLLSAESSGSPTRPSSYSVTGGTIPRKPSAHVMLLFAVSGSTYFASQCRGHRMASGKKEAGKLASMLLSQLFS